MIEVRWHGRGGQGAVTSVEMLALAAIEEGQYAQGFPSFGPERRGAPVAAFNRVDNKQIKVRSGVYDPDVVVVLDPSLVGLINVTEGLKQDGILIVNTGKSPEEIKEEVDFNGRVATVDASRIAWDELGVPITNTTMLGAVDQSNRPCENRIGKASSDAPVRKDSTENIKAMERAYTK